VVPGGSFYRTDPTSDPAMVSSFTLDRFEVTVGRFRQFVADYPNDKPAAGAGQSALLPASGWNSAWDAYLPETSEQLEEDLGCEQGLATWTSGPGANENLPINCVGWFVAFAFCAWDGGRLPTDAEWAFAAYGGDQQLTYPWGSTPAPDPTLAVYGCQGPGAMPDCNNPSLADLYPVGSRSPMGDGLWGHADLAGSVREWTLDQYGPFPVPCTGACVDASAPEPALHSAWGGDWAHDAAQLQALTATSQGDRIGYTTDPNLPTSTMDWTGFRCARAQ
jgi:formylglycine-generating enzyme required for sulfatase activity